MNATDWHEYKAASLNPTQAFNEAAPQGAGGISACNSNSFPVEILPRRANLVADDRDPFYSVTK